MRNKRRGMKLSEFYKIRRLSVLSLYSLIIILAIGFLLPFARTQVGVEALIDLTGDSTITMTSSKNSATVTIAPTMTGVFETTSGAGDIAFSVSTTNYSGYRLTARSTKTTLDKGVAGSFASLVSGVTAEQFGNANNTTLNNRWGYKPSFYNSEENTRYFGSSTTAVTLDQTSVANSTAKNYTISLGARADSSLPSGSYINDNFILETVANVVPTSILTISYGDHVTGVTIGGTSVTSGETVKLIVGAPYSISMTTDQYFDRASWTATTGTIASASSLSTTYTITSSNATLTATGLFNGPEIQNLSDANCTSTASLAIDTRDETIYQVKRLEDGRCWMMQNLDLGRTALSADLTSSNTNISSTISFSTFNNWVKAAGTWTYSGGEVIPVTGTDSVSDVPYGTLYNYYAVSAGTIAGYTNANNAVYDICPAGWRLPTGGTSGEFAAIYAYHDSYNDFRASEADGGLAYPLSGAFVQSGPESVDTAGIFWASTISTGSNWARGKYDISMQELFITEAIEEPIVIEEPSVFLGDADYRTLGIAARCIKKNPSHTLTINYGSGVQAVYVNGNLIANSGQISIEEGVPHPIKVIFDKNYAFSSWSATSGTIGTASEQFTTYTIGSSNATLTANGAVFTGGVIQNLDSSLCTTTEAKFKDNRDNQVYTVKRLADGRCWMMQNLDLGRTSLTVDLTSANSNLETTVPAATFNSWVTSSSPAAAYDSGVVVPVSGMSLESDIPKGTYYNFYAASGGTISGSTNANNSTHDICPAGWRLPTGGANSEMRIMSDMYSEDLMIRTPSAMGGAAFGITGYFGTNGTISQDGYGEYWTSTRSSNTNMRYLMTFGSGYGYNDNSTMNRRSGASIRCILDQMTISDLQYLQDFASLTNQERSEVASSMLEGQTYQLTDNRDSKVYNIAKMKDGRIWLAENLDLGRTTLSNDLTSANTNLGNTIPYATFNGWKKSTGTMTYANGEFINVTGTDEASGTAYGTLYNYYAATAGTIKGSESGEDAHFDICPAGWRLPTGGSSGEFQTLYTEYPSNARMRAPIAESGAAFTLAGIFYGGAPTYQEANGRLWSSTRVDSSNVNINFMSTTGVSPASTNGRRDGCSIRCIVKTNVYTLTISYGTGVSGVVINGVTYHNGDTVNLEPGVSNTITMTTSPAYEFTTWLASSGTVGNVLNQSTTYTIGSTNATLSVTATFSPPNLQNIDQSNCTSTPSIAVDTRDDHLYTIQRLDDGNCWMMENLDLGRTTLTTDLTSSNTNLSTTITAATFNSWKKTGGGPSFTDGEFISISGTDSVSGTDYGTLYNYYAASAGTVSGNVNRNNAVYDLCPAGWRLPIGTVNGEYQELYSYYNSFNNMRASIDNSGAAFALAGDFLQGTPTRQGSDGIFWASTKVTDTGMSALSLRSGSAYPSSSADRNLGASIRCVAKKTAHSVTVVYATGVSNVTVNGTSVPDGESISLEEGVKYAINAVVSNGYSFSAWSVSAGTIIQSSTRSMIYSVGSTDDTISMSTTFTGPNIQNLTSNNCTSTPNNAKDTRDGHVYTIQRLADGNCWMMENLDLGRATLTTDLTSSNTNLSTTIPAATFNSWKKTSGSQTNSDGEFFNVDGIDSTSETAYGTLYNYYAATAGTISGNSNTNNSTYDICPSGWRLPTGGSYNGEFQNLYAEYNSLALMRAPVSQNGAAFALAGSFRTTPGNQGNWGSYWSSTTQTETSRYYLFINGTDVYPARYNYRYDGYAIRCILNEPKTISELEYMQDFNNLTESDKASLLASMSYNTTYDLIDYRDNRTYKIAKMKDGNIWMAENLDLGKTNLTVSLTYANTNIEGMIPYGTFNGWITASAVGTNGAGEVMSVAGTDATSGTAYGTLYNYYAASAGEVSGNSYSANANHDICPAGWRLPTGSIYGEVYNLYSISDYNSPTLFRTPITSGGAGFSLAGVAWSGAPEYTSYYASYWTSSMASDTLAFRANINQSSVGADGSDNRSPLGSVRCIAKLSDKGITDYTKMQELRTLTSETKTKLLNSMAEKTNYTLVDARDSTSYTIAKLKDGNIWMTKNLDLGRTALSENLNSVNTNMSNPNIPYTTFNGWKKTSGTATYDTGEFINVSGSDATSGTPYGTLYNFYAASAGTISGSSNSSNAEYDICPSGWRLPTGGSSGEFQALYTEYNTNALMRAPIANGGAAFALAGYFRGSAPTGQGSIGYYWSSTRYNNTGMHTLNLDTSSVNPAYSSGNLNGLAIRCIVK